VTQFHFTIKLNIRVHIGCIQSVLLYCNKTWYTYLPSPRKPSQLFLLQTLPSLVSREGTTTLTAPTYMSPALMTLTPAWSRDEWAGWATSAVWGWSLAKLTAWALLNLDKNSKQNEGSAKLSFNKQISQEALDVFLEVNNAYSIHKSTKLEIL